MALFQPMQQGPSGSAVTPKAEVQDTSVNSILGFVEKAGTGLAGMFQDQAKSRSQQAVGAALTAFIVLKLLNRVLTQLKLVLVCVQHSTSTLLTTHCCLTSS